MLDPRIRSHERRTSPDRPHPRGRRRAQLRRRRFGHAGFVSGAAVITALVVVALLAPLAAPQRPHGQDWRSA